MDGKPVPYEAETTNDGYRLKVMADLPYRGEHTFTWKKGKNTFKALGDDNGKIGIKFDEDGLFILSLLSGEKFLYALKTQCNLLSRKNYVSGGALESVFTCALYFEGGKVYEIKIKLKKGSDFVEVYEEMSGFEENEAELHISWQGFEPMHRFTPERGEEKLDAYVDDQKKFPFSVCPFMPKTSWWDVRCAAYEDKHRGLWSGILLHDLKNFDDGRYAIWGSRQTLSFDLYEDKIKGRIASGKRAFMHIFCKDRSVTALRSHYLRYFSIVSLNKVKDYVLEWEDDKNSYPKYFCVQRNTKWGGFY